MKNLIPLIAVALAAIPAFSQNPDAGKVEVGKVIQANGPPQTIRLTPTTSTVPIFNGTTLVNSTALGAAAYVGTSTGGNGAADSGKVPVFSGSGGFIGTGSLQLRGDGGLGPGLLAIYNPADTFSVTYAPALGLASNKTFYSPAGTSGASLISSGDTATVTNTMLAGSIDASKITNTAAVLSAANTFTANQVYTPSADGGATMTFNTSAAGLRLSIGTLVGATTYGAIYGNVTPSASNYSFATNGTNVILNTSGGYAGLASSGVVYFAVGTGTVESRAHTTLGISLSPSSALENSTDIIMTRQAAGVLQFGYDTNGSPTNQTLKSHDGITGTDRSGANLTLASGDATGTGTSDVIVSTPAAGASGTTARTAAERMRVTSANVTFTSLPKLPSYTVATLPSTAATGMVAGACAYVTDALAPAYGTAVVGGGAVVTPVFYDGTNWTAR